MKVVDEYDQLIQTKFYDSIRWAISTLSQNYLAAEDIRKYFTLINEVKDVKNANSTFLFKITDKLIAKLKKRTKLFEELKKTTEDLAEYCVKINNISMKSKLETRLAELYFLNGHYSQAMDLCNKIIFDLKRYEDNLGLIRLQLLQSKIYFKTKGYSKAKASLTGVKTLVTKVYIEPKLQANIDMHAGIIAAQEKDFNLAYSYFFEAFDVFNLPQIRKVNKAKRCLHYMILSKIMAGKLEDINNIVINKNSREYIDNQVDYLRSIEKAVKESSILVLQDNILMHKRFFDSDDFIKMHLENLKNELLEKNLIKIIKPYSVVEIDFVTKAIGLKYDEVLYTLRKMILDKKINGILDQGKGSLILYEESAQNPYLEKTLETFKSLEKVVESLDKKVRATKV